MERLFSLSLVKAHSLFYTTQLQESEYFDGALKRNYQFLKVFQKIMCYHDRPFLDNVHAICNFDNITFNNISVLLSNISASIIVITTQSHQQLENHHHKRSFFRLTSLVNWAVFKTSIYCPVCGKSGRSFRTTSFL